MRIYWYWPVPHLGSHHPWPTATCRNGDEITVHSLVPAPDQVPKEVLAYVVKRELPRSQPVDRTRRLTWYTSRFQTYWRRARLREHALRSGRYDICHIHHVNRITDWWAIPRLRRFCRVVLTVHDVIPHVRRLPERLEDELLKRTYRAADALIVYHDVLRTDLYTRFGIKPDMITVVPHPIFDRDAADPEADGEPMVLFFGTFRANKGIDVLLHAIGQLQQHQEIQFVFAGRGDPSLENKVREAALHDPRIRHEIGRVTNQRRDDLMRTARLVVLPYSEFHSQSGVLAEAYGFGRPVVVTDVGAMGPTVRVDGSGWIARPNDPQDLAHRLDQALRDHKGRSNAARAALRATESRSYAIVGEQLRRLYDRLVTT